MYVCCFSFKVNIKGVPRHIVDFTWLEELDNLAIVYDCTGSCIACRYMPYDNIVVDDTDHRFLTCVPKDEVGACSFMQWFDRTHLVKLQKSLCELCHVKIREDQERWESEYAHHL
jgi:hypothetical protein